MDASVIVCTYNRAASLETMLASLRETDLDPAISWELLVVDNNSSDETRKVVERATDGFPAPVRYLFEGRQGLSYARNLGISEARGDCLLFTDDDVVVHPGWVQDIVAGFTSHDCLGIGGKIEAVWDQLRPAWYSNNGPYRLIGAIIEYDFGEAIRDVASPPIGANMAFRRDAFTRYGLFRTDLGVSGEGRISGEDTDFSRRLLRGGERILYLPTAIIYHPVEPVRLQKSYFERWYYNYGRTMVRAHHNEANNIIKYFGVPRYLFRSLLTDGMRWLTAWHPQRRFYYKLQCCHYLGEMIESYHTHKEQCRGACPADHRGQRIQANRVRP
jgi:glycosyltransferase involved in cell wall biosynthesis